MGGTGGMAGSDPAARDWGNDFDSGLSSTVDAHFSSIAALANCAELVDATATNHRNADGASVIGNKPTPEALGISKDNLLPNHPGPPPKSAGQPDNSEPSWWRWIKDRVGNIWPNGHQDKLRGAATALRSAADSCHGTANAMTAHIGTVKNQVSPEIDSAVHTLTTLQNSLNELGNAYTALASACDEHAHHIDEAHSEMEEEGAELLAWTVVDFLSDGAATAAAGRVAARVIETYAKFKRLLEAARVAIRATATSTIRLKSALKPIAEALSKIKSFGQKGKDLAKAEADAASAEIRQQAEQIGNEVKNLPKGSGKPGVLAQKLTDLHLSHEQAVDAAVSASKAAFGEVGGTAPAVGGGTVILPVYAVQKVVLIVREDGSVISQSGDVTSFIAK
ncbi:hypothetical protein NRB20_75320 [Nocardia sp. RB20]|uniref:Outer membrane channel protein CpnT-like N-terminal domain-containing protein n=2 Tax=Nocardia macrotermitis TaxID=2585198 RepID=A0A7K0DFB9_9NOCA|nr:hypothetical protein [Nocardia macrotermitis]